MRVLVEKTVGEAAHEGFKHRKDGETSSDDNEHNNNVATAQEDKFKEITNQWDGKGTDHDGDNSN